jgi:hypothetical protein
MAPGIFRTGTRVVSHTAARRPGSRVVVTRPRIGAASSGWSGDFFDADRDRVVSTRSLVENADTVSLVCALLERFPEIASIRSLPSERTLRSTMVLRQRLDRAAQASLIETIDEHVRGFLSLTREEPQVIRIECEGDRSMTFVHVTRDLETVSKEELELHVAFFTERFGDAVVRNSLPDDHFDADPVAQDEAALYAVEALRDPAQSKSLVGFREEKRVLVYFLKSRKKAKASARR